MSIVAALVGRGESGRARAQRQVSSRWSRGHHGHGGRLGDPYAIVRLLSRHR